MKLKKIKTPEYLTNLLHNLSREKNIQILLYFNKRKYQAEFYFNYKKGDMPLIKFKDEINPQVVEGKIKVSFSYHDIFFIFKSAITGTAENNYSIKKPDEIIVSIRRSVNRYKIRVEDKAIIFFNESGREYLINDISTRGLSFISDEIIVKDFKKAYKISIKINNGPQFITQAIVKNFRKNEDGTFTFGMSFTGMDWLTLRELFSFLSDKSYPYLKLLTDQNFDEIKELNYPGILSDAVYGRYGRFLALGLAKQIYNQTFLARELITSPSGKLTSKIKKNILTGLADYLIENPNFNYYLGYIVTDYDWYDNLFSAYAGYIKKPHKMIYERFRHFQYRAGEVITPPENSLYVTEELDSADEFIEFSSNNIPDLERECCDYRKKNFEGVGIKSQQEKTGILMERMFWKIINEGDLIAYAVAEAFSGEAESGFLIDNCRLFFVRQDENLSSLLESFLPSAALFYKNHSREEFNLFIKMLKEKTSDISIPGLTSLPPTGRVIMSLEGLTDFKNLLAADFIKFEKFYELSYPQKLIWYSEKLYPNTSLGNNAGTFRVKNGLNFEILEKAVNIFLQKNEGARLRLVEKDGEPRQYVSNYKPYRLDRLDFTKSGDLSDFYAWEENTNYKPFALIDSDLFYFAMIDLPNGESALYLKQHHTISDGWAVLISYNQIFEYYSLLKSDSIVPEIDKPSYLEFLLNEGEFETSEKYIQQKEFWDKQFETVPDFIYIKNRKTGSFSTKAQRKGVVISTELSKQINSFCREKDLSLFSLFFAVLAVYISRITSKTDLSLGTSILNRLSAKERETVGMFVNMLPIRLNLSIESSFELFARSFTSKWKLILKNQKYPYLLFLHSFKKNNNVQNEIFDVTFSYQNAMVNINPSLGKFKTRWHPNGYQTNALNIFLNDREGGESYILNFDYLVDLFTEEEINRMGRHLLNMVEDAINNFSKKLFELELLSEAEKHKLIYDFNNTAVDFPRNKTVHQLFEEQAAKTPEHIAVVFEEEKITYCELNQKANQLAHILRSKGVKPDRIVAIMTERSIEMVVGILSILKAGGAYLPIDPEYPEDRILYMLEDSQTDLLLTQRHLAEKVIKMAWKGNILEIDNTLLYKESNMPLQNINKPTDLVYVIYTSGSTGKPKGVMVEHRSLINLINWHLMFYNINGLDNSTQYASLGFDASVWELFPNLIGGTTIYIVGNEEKFNINHLNEFYNKNNISISFLPTQVSEQFMKIENRSLKKLLTGGDRLRNSFDTKYEVYNNYGPTENTVVTTSFSLKNKIKTESIPIGKPIFNIKVYILGDKNLLQPIGIPGELCISGVGLARGYLNQPELTAEKFVTNPFIPEERMYKTGDLARWLPDGNIEFLGRIDNQVKIRDFRIELGEIESRLLECPQVKEAVVIARDDSGDNKFLCAYYTGEKGLDISELRNHLLKWLPEYMIPSYYIYLENMPHTINGKIDRKKLPKQTEDSVVKQEYIAPRDEIEKNLCIVFEKILHINKIGIDDDIFKLGSDSLLLIQVVGSLFKYQWNISIQDFYSYPTIRSISALIRGEIKRDEKEGNIIIFQRKVDNNQKNTNFNTKKAEYHNILLTGSTGYLGIHLLDTLLQTTNAVVYCMIRGKNIQEAESKLLSKLDFYFNDKHGKILSKRINVIKGDITIPNLGLSEIAYKEIGEKIDTVIHSAADVQHSGDYRKISDINVEGTRYMARFTFEFGKIMHYISTLSVSGDYVVRHNEKKPLFTENDFYIGQNYLEQVYVRSKFEAENFLFFEMEKGLNASIYRIGNLSERYSDGKFQLNIRRNLIHNIIKSILESGVFPSQIFNEEIEFTPVDFCAQAVVEFSQCKGSLGKVFHLFNYKYRKIGEILRVMSEILGRKIDIIENPTFKDYVEYVSKKSNNSDVLDVIKKDFNFEKIFSDEYRANINCDLTKCYLNQIGFDWPEIDGEYLEKIINNWIKRGFIGKNEPDRYISR